MKNSWCQLKLLLMIPVVGWTADIPAVTELPIIWFSMKVIVSGFLWKARNLCNGLRLGQDGKEFVLDQQNDSL